jgi:hypothetical protein
VIVQVVDLADIHQKSFIPKYDLYSWYDQDLHIFTFKSFNFRLGEIAGRNPIWVIGNKYDLLPDGAKETRIRSYLHSFAKDEWYCIPYTKSSGAIEN